jgi:hypothetical protein
MLRKENSLSTQNVDDPEHEGGWTVISFSWIEKLIDFSPGNKGRIRKNTLTRSSGIGLSHRGLTGVILLVEWGSALLSSLFSSFGIPEKRSCLSWPNIIRAFNVRSYQKASCWEMMTVLDHRHVFGFVNARSY